MICPKCNKETPNEYKYCVNCGQEIQISDSKLQSDYVSVNYTQPTNSGEQIQSNLQTDQIVVPNQTKKKSKLKIIIPIVLLILAAIITLAIFVVNLFFNKQYIYRDTNWGMSKEQVMELENSKNNTPDINNDTRLYYSVSDDELFGQEPLSVGYTFEGENNSLSKIFIITTDDSFSDGQFSDLYKKLEDKFGEPSSKYGETGFYMWKLDTTKISLLYDSDEKYVCLLFSDKSIEDSNDDNTLETD